MGDLDWGAVPDYLPALTALGAILLFLREWHRERQSREDERAREREAVELSAAIVAATLVPPQRTDGLSRGLRLKVENYAAAPIFDVRASVDYRGSAPVEDAVRHLVAERTVLAAGAFFDLSAEASRWPVGVTEVGDFTWEITFRDVRNNRWRRGPWGPPVRLPADHPEQH